MVQELRTPDEWMAVLHPGIRIMNPDGWRGLHGRPYTDAISREEFEQRYQSCTIMGGFDAPGPS